MMCLLQSLGSRQQAHEKQSLLGGAEAEGFGVGVGREGPTPGAAVKASYPNYAPNGHFSWVFGA